MQTNLKHIRELSGKTQERVASDLGISLSTYRSWEQGKRGLNGKKLDKLADYFQVSTDTILGTAHAQPLEEIASKDKQPMLLNADEARLITLYRQMSDDDKNTFIQNAQIYAYAGEQKKEAATRVAEIVE